MQPLQFDLSEQRTRNFTYSPFASSYDINQNLIELNNNTTDQTDYQQRYTISSIFLHKKKNADGGGEGILEERVNKGKQRGGATKRCHLKDKNKYKKFLGYV